MSERNEALLEAYNRGYRISRSGYQLKTNKNVLKHAYFIGGYPVFAIRINGKKVNIMWHRLQAYQKYGDKLFEDEILVRHLNSIKTDCSFENIVIGTAIDNSMDKPAEDRLAYSLNATNSIRKYNATEVRKFHKLNNNSAKLTMEKFGISSKGTLHYILKKAKHS